MPQSKLVFLRFIGAIRVTSAPSASCCAVSVFYVTRSPDDPITRFFLAYNYPSHTLAPCDRASHIQIEPAPY
jgi:hypothetical protein